ncbi:MAG: DUF3592 domain-containing protein [Pseudomonadota bacterium]
METEPITLFGQLTGLPEIFALIFGAIGGLVFYFGLVLRGRGRELKRRGMTARGKVVDKEWVLSDDDDVEVPRARGLRRKGMRRRDGYRVTFTFRTGLGETRTETMPASGAFYKKVAVGDAVSVRYLPHDPSVAEIEQGRAGAGATVCIGVGLLFAVPAIGYLVSSLMETQEAIAARDRGAVIEASVVAVARTNVKINERRQFRLVWRMPDDGSEHRSWMGPRGDFSGLPVGSTITVFRHPTALDAVYWEGDTGPRVVGR